MKRWFGGQRWLCPGKSMEEAWSEQEHKREESQNGGPTDSRQCRREHLPGDRVGQDRAGWGCALCSLVTGSYQGCAWSSHFLLPKFLLITWAKQFQQWQSVAPSAQQATWQGVLTTSLNADWGLLAGSRAFWESWVPWPGAVVTAGWRQRWPWGQWPYIRKGAVPGEIHWRLVTRKLGRAEAEPFFRYNILTFQMNKKAISMF